MKTKLPLGLSACAAVFLVLTLFFSFGAKAAGKKGLPVEESKVFASSVNQGSALGDNSHIVLSEADEKAYRRIFFLQERERWQEADAQIKKLNNKILMGHVLAQRYLDSVTYKTKAKEIEAWFQKYGTQTEAARMYNLGKIKKASLKKRRPKPMYGAGTGACATYVRDEPVDSIRNLSFSYLSTDRRKKAKKVMNGIYRALLNGKTLTAKNLILGEDAKNLFNAKDHDAAKIALGFSYFIDGRDDLALEMLVPAVKRSGDRLPLGHWTLGLVSWRKGDIETAAYHFEKLIDHKRANTLLKAGGAFWASRANLKLGNVTVVNAFLEKGSRFPRTFYGLLSMRALGEDLNHTWEQPVSPSDEIQESFSHPALQRVYALKQVGQEKKAQAELLQLYLNSDESTRPLLYIAAQSSGLADDLAAVSGRLESSSDRSRYPAPLWMPMNGWQVDKALVFAFVRQESCFNPRAKSSRGAIGLMQIMPQTAKETARSLKVKWEYDRLTDIDYNLALGQAYLKKLLEDKRIENNLIFLAVAYNSGPGNLSKWRRKMKYNDDPFLFIESIPSKETRAFVERIITNYWIYRSLFRQPLYSLDEVIAGRWPMYNGFDVFSDNSEGTAN